MSGADLNPLQPNIQPIIGEPVPGAAAPPAAAPASPVPLVKIPDIPPVPQDLKASLQVDMILEAEQAEPELPPPPPGYVEDDEIPPPPPEGLEEDEIPPPPPPEDLGEDDIPPPPPPEDLGEGGQAVDVPIRRGIAEKEQPASPAALKEDGIPPKPPVDLREGRAPPAAVAVKGPPRAAQTPPENEESGSSRVPKQESSVAEKPPKKWSVNVDEEGRMDLPEDLNMKEETAELTSKKVAVTLSLPSEEDQAAIEQRKSEADNLAKRGQAKPEDRKLKMRKLMGDEPEIITVKERSIFSKEVKRELVDTDPNLALTPFSNLRQKQLERLKFDLNEMLPEKMKAKPNTISTRIWGAIKRHPIITTLAVVVLVGILNAATGGLFFAAAAAAGLAIAGAVTAAIGIAGVEAFVASSCVTCAMILAAAYTRHKTRDLVSRGIIKEQILDRSDLAREARIAGKSMPDHHKKMVTTFIQVKSHISNIKKRSQMHDTAIRLKQAALAYSNDLLSEKLKDKPKTEEEMTAYKARVDQCKALLAKCNTIIKNNSVDKSDEEDVLFFRTKASPLEADKKVLLSILADVNDLYEGKYYLPKAAVEVNKAPAATEVDKESGVKKDIKAVLIDKSLEGAELSLMDTATMQKATDATSKLQKESDARLSRLEKLYEGFELMDELESDVHETGISSKMSEFFDSIGSDEAIAKDQAKRDQLQEKIDKIHEGAAPEKYKSKHTRQAEVRTLEKHFEEQFNDPKALRKRLEDLLAAPEPVPLATAAPETAEPVAAAPAKPIKIDIFDREGRTKLYNAVAELDVDKVKELLKQNADPALVMKNKRIDKEENTPWRLIESTLKRLENNRELSTNAQNASDYNFLRKEWEQQLTKAEQIKKLFTEVFNERSIEATEMEDTVADLATTREAIARKKAGPADLPQFSTMGAQARIKNIDPAKIDEFNSMGRTGLFNAVVKLDVEQVRMLRKNNADPNLHMRDASLKEESNTPMTAIEARIKQLKEKLPEKPLSGDKEPDWDNIPTREERPFDPSHKELQEQLAKAEQIKKLLSEPPG